MNIKKTSFVLFFIALIVRLSILLFFDHNRIPIDGTGYHRMAVNLVRGNGFSNQEEKPFERTCFREVGYPYFLAGVYSAVNLFHPVQYIEKYDINCPKLDKIYPEIVAAKLVQIILDSLGIVLLFLILLEISSFKIAFLTGLFTAIYFNLAFHSLFILRETLVLFLLLVLNYLYIKFLFKEKKTLWLLLIGIITGLLILIFQVHIIILPVLFVLLLIHYKEFKKAIISSSLVSIVAIIVILPNCINSYIYYPDIRIFKTVGSSLTYEMIKYDNAISFLFDNKLITQEDAGKMRQWNEPSKNQFERSFNGYYSHKTDSLTNLAPKNYSTFSFVLKQKLIIYFTNFKKSFFLTKFGYESGKNLFNSYGYIILISLVIIPFLIGFLGIIGILFFWKHYMIYFLPFIVYLTLFWLLGSEYRRMIILQPFLIFFSLLLLNKIYEYKIKYNIRRIYKV